MPKYELMYIIGSETADDEIPKINEEIKKSIEKFAGLIEKHEEIGKKKLAYPIKRTRNGHYVLMQFSTPGDKINDIEHAIRTNQSVIRHLIINIDDDLIRIEKDRIVHSKMKPRREVETLKTEPTRRNQSDNPKKIEIDLDAEIEKAIDSNELK